MPAPSTAELGLNPASAGVTEADAPVASPVPEAAPAADFLGGKLRGWIVAAQVLLVGAVLAYWMASGGAADSRSLWMLFLYCLPSEFLIATVPHEPVLLYYARFVDPWTVALVSVAGTVLTEYINYSVIRFMADLRTFRRLTGGPRVQRIVRLFERAPFTALLVAAATPVPFYPFRFLVVMARYPVAAYLAAVFVGRLPRFYLIALVGEVVAIPDGWLVAIFVSLLAAAYLPAVVRRIRTRLA